MSILLYIPVSYQLQLFHKLWFFYSWKSFVILCQTITDSVMMEVWNKDRWKQGWMEMGNWGWDRERAEGSKWWDIGKHTADRRRNRYIEGKKGQTRTYWAREVHDRASPNCSCKTNESLGIDLMQEERRLNERQVGNGCGCRESTWHKEERRLKEHWVGNASMRCKGVRGFGSALLRCKLAWDGARGFRIGKGCSGMVLMTWEWCRQVGIGPIGVGTVTVVTRTLHSSEWSDAKLTWRNLASWSICYSSLKRLLLPLCSWYSLPLASSCSSIPGAWKIQCSTRIEGVWIMDKLGGLISEEVLTWVWIWEWEWGWMIVSWPVPPGQSLVRRESEGWRDSELQGLLWLHSDAPQRWVDTRVSDVRESSTQGSRSLQHWF